MAFRLRVVGNYEYRGQQSGISSKTSKQWLSIIVEDDEAQQLNVSVPTEMIRDVYNMHLVKGDRIHIAFVATARADGNSYIMLSALPELVSDMDDTEF